MSRLADIPVHVIPPPAPADLVLALLHELRHALHCLLADGQETAIELERLPLPPAELNRLLDLLGTGEVTVHLTALGTSLIRETRFPGIWLTEHLADDGQPASRLLEVTTLPALLKSPLEDIQRGLEALSARLEAGGDTI